MVQVKAVSKAEAVKAQSGQLRGHLFRDLADGAANFDEEERALLKFHGVYQGYDRDSATARKQSGQEKVWQFMVRTKIPGGRLGAVQYLALDEIAGRFANGTLRITTRQDIQFHGVIKSDLKATIGTINRALLTTLGACGDVVRNVTTVPAPIRDARHRRIEEDALRLSAHLLPRTRAYREIWIDGAPWEEEKEGAEEAPDPLYGDTYLPRKFKIGLALPEDNTIDVLSNDLAILALFEKDRLTGYNFLLGGGGGMTHNNPATFPRIASPVAFIPPEHLLEAAAAVVRLHRDYGDRVNRRHARLKYVMAEKGEDWARERLCGYLGILLEPCRAMPPFEVPDHLGWHEQGDGRLYLGIPVASGRIADDGRTSMRSALREIVRRFSSPPILLPSQDIILSELRPQDGAEIEAILTAHGVGLSRDMLPVERWALACPALPTCGLALTEAERVRDRILAAVATALRRYGIERERLSLRITGCPNGCARPYTGDIGIVGRMPGFYALFVGGDFAGTRLSRLVADKLALGEIAGALEPLFALFTARRHEGEGFGDFCHRFGEAALKEALASRLKGAA
jgi:sulfite reductase (ferredoxin)